MREFAMTIDGAAAPAATTFDVLNPATNEVYARAPGCSPEQLDAAMDSASRAFREWSRDEDARRVALAAAGKIVMDAVPELAPILTAEQGKPLSDAQGEVFGAGMWLQHFAQEEIPLEIVHEDEATRVEILRRPVGVVSAITAWNYPLILAAFKLAPALRAGATAVLKPSPYTPLSTLALGELLRDVFPPGVLNIVSGGDDLGVQLTRHPVPRKISFTGSIATGKAVAAAAADDLKRITLELGGNDPAIVLDDADVSGIVDQIFWTAFANCGQTCNAIKRIYAPESLYDEMVEALADRARGAKVGDGMVEGTQLGPINNRPQFERVRGFVAEAIDAGADAVAGGGAIPGAGNFFEPTILANVEDDARVVVEEQFGPVLPVIPYRSVDDAVAQANRTNYGLSASVWSVDPERAAAVSVQLEAGTVWVNAHMAAAPGIPFRGAKWSGIGWENGLHGLLEYTEPQVLHRRKTGR